MCASTSVMHSRALSIALLGISGHNGKRKIRVGMSLLTGSGVGVLQCFNPAGARCNGS